MRLRLFKTPTNWRGFVSEIAIIVIGVLIALWAQQLVEDRGDRVRADSALAALREEVAESDFAASEIQIVRPCIDAQLDAIEKRLVAGDRALVPLQSDNSRTPFVVRAPTRVWPDSAWQSVNASDVLRRLEPERERYISSFYAQIANQRLARERVNASGHELNALGHIVPVGEAERMRLITTIEQFRGDIADMDLVSGQLRNYFAAAGLLASKSVIDGDLSHSGTIKFCRANGFPLGKVRPAIAADAD